MFQTPVQCPVCHDDLLVTRLVCRNCGTALEGRFAMGPLAQLSADQWHFVETFLRNEGKLNRVQEELGLSYPTVRSRLDDVIRALGYDVREQAPATAGVAGDDRQRVLEQLARHEISSEEALALLQEKEA